MCSLAYFSCLHLLPNYFLIDFLITVPYFSFSWFLKFSASLTYFSDLLCCFSLSFFLSLSLSHTHIHTHTHTHTHTPVLSLIFRTHHFPSTRVLSHFRFFVVLSDSQSACCVLSRGNWMTQLFTFSYTQKKSVWGARPLHCRAYLAMTHVMWGRINREHLALLNFSFKDLKNIS